MPSTTADQVSTSITTDEELESAIKTALDCPCVKDLREGPCGSHFVAAFTCFHRSKDVVKGADCLQQNMAFANCLAAHPEVHINGDSEGQMPLVPGQGLPGNVVHTGVTAG
eukprot:CAMPEP_0202896970 /NCGR_PEP_ID=MMETSP1392-20130828/5855_1 /ASSEMBLY_ACC=CAM_ASM_000868 /TAXON_ID=225041 /ORGANISM="Chlamydomonas chlamydogama, Strain SAG 11-48b" /LENGTH=110 /DNA_ID=CAMNT_0049582497 /DNA_START=132 /DNA_END=464 /DNA_ORIENTATION=+